MDGWQKQISHKYYSLRISIPFRHFLGDVRREFMQRLSVVLHGTLGPYLRYALQEGGAAAVACLPTPRSQASIGASFLFFSPLPFSLLPVHSTTFFVINKINNIRTDIDGTKQYQ
jgi:hypothetical protein